MWPFRKKQSQRLSQDNIEWDRRMTEPVIAFRQELIDRGVDGGFYLQYNGTTVALAPDWADRNQSMLDDYKRACEAAWEQGEWAPSLGEPLL